MDCSVLMARYTRIDYPTQQQFTILLILNAVEFIKNVVLTLLKPR